MMDAGRILEEGAAIQMITDPVHDKTRRFLTQIAH
jgi:ABC-type antimicrobial peptide transport system ATPase subunit